MVESAAIYYMDYIIGIRLLFVIYTNIHLPYLPILTYFRYYIYIRIDNILYFTTMSVDNFSIKNHAQTINFGNGFCFKKICLLVDATGRYIFYFPR